VALVDRTAYQRLPRAVAARELAEVFTPTGEEVSWARAKTTTDQHCLMLLVLLKCYQRLGYFPRPEQIPAEIAEHVRGCVELTSAGSVGCRRAGPAAGAVDRGSAKPAQSARGADSTGAEGNGDPVEEAFNVPALAR